MAKALSNIFSFSASSEEGERQWEIQKRLAQPIKDRTDALSDLKNARRDNRDSIIRSGRILAGLRLSYVEDEKISDPNKEWRVLLAGCALSDQIAKEMMLVSQSERILDPINQYDLPNELGALVQVAAMSDDEFSLGKSLQQIRETSSASQLKTYRRVYKSQGREKLLNHWNDFKKSAGSNSKVYRLPKLDSVSDSLRSFGTIKFDLSVVDSQEKYNSIAKKFRDAVGKIDGVSWVKEPKEATIENLYKDTAGVVNAKAVTAADKWVATADMILATVPANDEDGTERPIEDRRKDAIEFLSKPSKAVLEKLPEDHRVFEFVSDPRKTFSRQYRPMDLDTLRERAAEDGPDVEDLIEDSYSAAE